MMINTNEQTPQKVLLISYEYGRRIAGGVGRVVNGIFNTMSKDIVLDVFAFKSPLTYVYDLAYVYRKDEQNKIKCLYGGAYKNVFLMALQQEKYDIVNITAGGIEVCWCIKEIKKAYPHIKIIYSCHSIIKHEIGVRNCSIRYLIYENFIINNVDHIHVLNRTTLNYLNNSYRDVVNKKQVSVIANGIDEADFTIIDQGFKNNMLGQFDKNKDTLVFCLSRWSFGKGLEYLVEAISRVTQTHKNVKFIIAGRKIQSWENKVEEYVQMIDEKIKTVSKYVITLGWLDNKERNAIFSIADICVMPSLLEYFPYGVLEPMICKVPLISSNIDSVKELLEEDKDCLLFTSKDPDELADKIICLIENKNKRDAISKNAYQKVRDLYNWVSISDKYASMYQSL